MATHYAKCTQVTTSVCEYFGVAMEDLLGQGKINAVSHPRMVAMYLLRHMTGLSYLAVAQKLGRGDHTTAMYACERVEELMASNPALRDSVQAIRDKLEQRWAGPQECDINADLEAEITRLRGELAELRGEKAAPLVRAEGGGA